MKNRVFWSRFFLAASILTAIAIFCFSAQSGPDSAELSEGVTLTVARVVRPGFDELPAPEKLSFMDQLGLVVRKCAHFSEFALLAFNLACWLRLRRMDRPRAAALLPAWVIATLYAGTDELHQMFVEARGPAILDVGIDSAGALTGALVALAAMAIFKMKSLKTENRISSCRES